MTLPIAALALLIWAYCLFFRGSYWRAPVEGDEPSPAPAVWPHIVAIVPARNEADSIADSLASLHIQDYPGRFSVILVDDHSEDATASIAAALPTQTGSPVSLTVLRAEPLPEGW